MQVCSCVFLVCDSKVLLLVLVSYGYLIPGQAEPSLYESSVVSASQD